jgi:hypothetical protein
MLENIVKHLDKVRKVGNEYRACCPVHDDNSPSMTLTEKDGKVLAYCFACGANGMDVIKALGLSVNEIFDRQMSSREAKERKLRDTDIEDKFIISMFEKGEEAGERFSHKDYRRYRLAIYRQDLLNQMGENYGRQNSYIQKAG